MFINDLAQHRFEFYLGKINVICAQYIQLVTILSKTKVNSAK
jgi:hypothetical protein